MRTAILLALGVLAGATVPRRASAPGASAPREVEVVGLDYAFRAPAELPAGPTVFRFVNRGKVRHELNILLLAPGVTVEQLNTIAYPDKPRDAETVPRLSRMIEATVGVLFAEPGERASATLATELLPGRTYAVRCVARDSANAPAHFGLGMYTALHVASASPARRTRSSAPPVRADTIVATDYAFRYPRTLSPGPHTFAFVNAGGQRHMGYLGLLPRGVTVERLMELAKARRDPRSGIEQHVGVLHSFAAAPQPLGVLQVGLLPGRDYVLLCFISDGPAAPPHLMLGMTGTIHVAER